MLNVLLLDPQVNKPYRISKDTSGGYGTGNDFGDKFFSATLKRALKAFHDWPPLFAAYVFSVLKKKGHNIKYTRDVNFNLNNIDVVIIVSSIVCFETEIECIKKIKNLKKNIKLFAIGPFASNNSSEYLKNKAIVVLGEPEFFFLSEGDLMKFEDGTIAKNDKKLTLDDIPYPSWNEILNKDFKASILFGNKKTLPIIGTRGCPYSCFQYCVYPLQQGRTVRQRTPKNIVDELIYWKKEFNAQAFIFRDPVFSINKKHTMELCNEIINRDVRINFIIETHLRILDEELIDILKKAGLVGVKVGIESSNLNVLKEANRFTVSKDIQLEKINLLESKNINVSAMYIIGYPEDTTETIKETINYAIKLNTTYAQFAVWTPYPGTPIYEKYKDKIIVKKFEDFNQYKLVFNHKNLSQRDIRNFLSDSYTKYYLRFDWIKKYINFLKN